MKKNILITGVNGFIGKNLCNYLTSKNYNVYGIDNFFSSERKDFQIIKSQNLFFRERSILDKDIFKESPFAVDTVIHLAAQTSVLSSFENVTENNRINIKGFENILLLCKQNNVKNFVFASSCAIYGDSILNPKNEKYSKPNPKSPYAESKLENEKFSSNDTFNEINIIGLRDGEKIHESLCTSEEMSRAINLKKFFRIPGDLRNINYDSNHEWDYVGNVKIFDPSKMISTLTKLC